MSEIILGHTIARVSVENDEVFTKYNLGLHTGTRGTNRLKKLVTAHVQACTCTSMQNDTVKGMKAVKGLWGLDELSYAKEYDSIKLLITSC